MLQSFDAFQSDVTLHKGLVARKPDFCCADAQSDQGFCNLLSERFNIIEPRHVIPNNVAF